MSPETERLLHALAHPLLAALAMARARRAPAHRVVAALFLAYTTATLLRLLLAIPLDAASPPYTGALRVAYYVDHAAYAAFAFAFLGAVAVHYARARALWFVVAWVVTMLVFIVWKEVTQLPAIQFQEWIAFGSMVLATGVVARAILAPASQLVRPDTAHVVLALVLCTDIVNRTIHGMDGLVEAWPLIRAIDLAVYILVALGYCAMFARDWRARWLLRRT